MTRLLFVVLLAGCGGEDKKNPCAGVDCGNGTCVADGVGAHCACDPGFIAVALTCVPEDEASPDIDEDGVLNDDDVCPAYPDPDQDDEDGDGIGDLCESRAIVGAPQAGTVATRLPSGRVVFTGLRDGVDIVLEGRMYDPDDDAILSVPGAPQHPHTSGSAVTLPDGRALFCGGEGEGGPTERCDYFEEGPGFSAAPSMTEGRTFYGWVLLPDGRFVVTGGMGVDAFASVEIFEDGAWLPGPALDGPFPAGNAAVVLDDGRVLISGGVDSCETGDPPSAGAMIWDPVSGNVEALDGELVVARWGHSMARLWDGRVVVVGGVEAPCGQEPILPAETIEIFDPATGEFSMLAEGAPHLTAAVVPLADGSILALGGVDEQFDAQIAASRITVDGLATDPPFEAPPLLSPRSLFIAGAVMLHDGSVFAGPSRLSETEYSSDAERIFPYYDVVIDSDQDGVVDVLQ